MKMKEIIRQLCNLPDGEYKVKNKIGNIEIINQKYDNGRSVTCEVYVKCNDQEYMKITSIPSKSLISEQRILTKDKIEYLLIHDYYNENNDYIVCVENEQAYKISKGCIVNNSTKKEYSINNKIMTSRSKDNESIIITYNIDTNEKLLYLMKKNGNNNIRPINLNPGFVQIKKDARNVLNEYNKIIENANNLVLTSIMNNDRLKKFRSELIELVSEATIPTIDVEKIDELDREISCTLKVYKKYISKLEQTHSQAMVETLSYVADSLTRQYCTIPEITPKNRKLSKIFNISKFINK